MWSDVQTLPEHNKSTIGPCITRVHRPMHGHLDIGLYCNRGPWPTCMLWLGFDNYCELFMGESSEFFVT